MVHMGGCQNYDPSLGTLNTRCRIIIGIQKGTIILTTAHISPEPLSFGFWTGVKFAGLTLALGLSRVLSK